MRVNVLQGPNAGRTLDMSTKQAEGAIAGGWAKRVEADAVVLPSTTASSPVTATADPVVETAEADPAPRSRRGGGR